MSSSNVECRTWRTPTALSWRRTDWTADVVGTWDERARVGAYFALFVDVCFLAEFKMSCTYIRRLEATYGSVSPACRPVLFRGGVSCPTYSSRVSLLPLLPPLPGHILSLPLFLFGVYLIFESSLMFFIPDSRLGIRGIVRARVLFAILFGRS